MTEVVKRDGNVVSYDRTKIREAIQQAMIAVEMNVEGSDLAEVITKGVEQRLGSQQKVYVESIQDAVEQELVKNNLYHVAKAFILYRSKRTEVRELSERIKSGMIESYLSKDDWRVKENSNMTYSLQGMNFHISGLMVADFWLNKLYSKEVADAYRRGDLHLHDLSILGVYCVGWELRDLLMQGFKGVRGKTSSGPAKHFRSALGQIVNFFYTMQGEAAGAQAFSNFDTLLAPFVRKDKLNYEQVKQAMQEFVFNMNVPTRVGFQTPFTNVTMDLEVPEYMKNEPVVLGGEWMEYTYEDFQPEMDMINKAFAEVMLEGDNNERVFTFPIPTYSITEEFDWDNPNYDKIWEMTARYGIPYFSNFVGSDMSPEDARSMCCRLRLDNRELRKRGGGLFGANPLTGSIGVVTLNLARIGYLAKDKEDYFSRVKSLMDIAKESLETKRSVLEDLTNSGLYPYSQFYLREVKEGTGKYWVNHFSTIGIIGMNESLLNFLDSDLTEKEGHDFAEEVLDFMRETLSDYQDETGNIYNLEATPAEGLSYKSAKKDKEVYPDIIVANEDMLESGAAPYYTNSSQLPVNYSVDLFDSLQLQDGLQTKYTGGTVFHAFLGEAVPSIESVKKMVRKICFGFSLPYFTLTPTFSICPTHGYLKGEHYTCPQCLAKGKEVRCEVYSRVVGYLRPVDQWNDGKQSEFERRVEFVV